jgi:hypothetical protein
MRHTVGGAQKVVTEQRRISSSTTRGLNFDWLQTKTVAPAFQGAKKQLQACLAQPRDVEMNIPRHQPEGLHRGKVADRIAAMRMHHQLRLRCRSGGEVENHRLVWSRLAIQG